MKQYLFWSEKHGDVDIFAENEEEAWEKFYDDHNGSGDYEVVIHEVDEKTNQPCYVLYMAVAEGPDSFHSALVLAPSGEDAKAQFREIYPEITLDVKAHLAVECPACEYINYEKVPFSVRDSWDVESYHTSYKCESCGERFGGDLGD